MNAEHDAVPEADEEPLRKYFETNANSAREAFGRFNLGIIGNSGVGKSSLVNAVFGSTMADVGVGLPITKGVHYYSDETLGIWDFEGFEIGSTRAPIEQLRENLQTISSGPAGQQISVIWYCVNSHADRLQPPEIEMIRELTKAGLPVILVLTKVDWVRNPVTGKYRAPDQLSEFLAWLEAPVDRGGSIHLPIERVILTAAKGAKGKGAGHGLGDLVAETLALSPDSDKDAFRVAQKLNLPWKREMARPVIATATVAAATVAAVPIPITNALALAPIQMGMMGRISAIYGLDLNTMMSTTAIAHFGVQVTGKALAAGFIKLIPGAGSVISASVAGALTAATGEAWLRLCEQVHTGKIEVGKIEGQLQQYLPSYAQVLAKLVTQSRTAP